MEGRSEEMPRSTVGPVGYRAVPCSTLNVVSRGGFVQANQETARLRQEIGNTSCFSERVALKFVAPICLATAICPVKRLERKYEAASAWRT